MTTDPTPKRTPEERLAALERAGDDLASIALLAADPAAFDDPDAIRRDLRDCAAAWMRVRGRG